MQRVIQPLFKNEAKPINGHAIGIDIGGTKISASCVSFQSRMKEPCTWTECDTIETPKETQAFMKALTDLVALEKTNLQRPAAPRVVGISTAGVVDIRTGVIIGSTGNLPAVQAPFPMRKQLEDSTNMPVHLENDANAAAYGEFKVGAARGYQDVLMITLGTGVGCGIVFNGQLVRGANFSAGEGGHITISMNNDRLCSSGKWDSWEAYASGTGLLSTIRQVLQEDPERPDAKAIMGNKTLDEITNRDVVPLWVTRDNKVAMRIKELWHVHIAAGLGSLINMLDPGIVVVGGGLSPFVNFVDLQEELLLRVISPAALKTPIVQATLGNQAGFIGAAYLAMETFS